MVVWDIQIRGVLLHGQGCQCMVRTVQGCPMESPGQEYSMVIRDLDYHILISDQDYLSTCIPIICVSHTLEWDTHQVDFLWVLHGWVWIHG